LHREKEETEQDAFPAAWPHIRQSPYRHLVLPPDCRFVPVHNNDASLAKQGKPSTTRVVVAGARWCIDMLKNLSTAKEFFVTLFTWLLQFFKKKQEEEDEVEEKEDEKGKDEDEEPKISLTKPASRVDEAITTSADVGESSTSDENAPPPRPQHHHMEFDMDIVDADSNKERTLVGNDVKKQGLGGDESIASFRSAKNTNDLQEQNQTNSLGSLDDIVPSNSQLGGTDAIPSRMDRSNSPVPFLIDSAKVCTPPSSPRLLPIQRSGNKRKDKLEVG
jgi:hypothetical protein